MRTTIAVVLLATLLSGQESAIVSFRKKADPEAVERGWLLKYDDQGFTFEGFGGARQIRILWSELREEDAKKIRRRFSRQKAEAGLLDGVRIHFKGGLTTEGVLERVDEQGKHWVRSGGILLPYPMDRIERTEPIRIKETAVFTERELFVRQLQRRPPRDAAGHRGLADYAFDIGEFRKAKEHYQFALRLRPDWRPSLVERLAEIDVILKDAALERELGIVKRAIRLEHDYDRASARLKRLLFKHPDKRSLARAEDELRIERNKWLRRRFHVVKHQEFKRAVHGYLRTKSPTIDQAMAWTRSKLMEQTLARIRQRLGLSEEQASEFAKTKAKGSPHWANYWSATFVISKRAKKGPWSRKVIRGDPNAWWFTYSDRHTRGNFLRAYAAERLPNLFEIVQIKLKPCEKCGGTGRIKHVSLRSLEALDGGHEWFETCPRCYGARNDRVVGYR